MKQTETRAEKILKALHQDFLDSTREALNCIEDQTLLRGSKVESALLEINRMAHNIKGNGYTFNKPQLGILAHRMEDYLRSLSDLDDFAEGDLLLYVNILRNVLEATDSIPQDELCRLMRKLPTKKTDSYENVEAFDIDIDIAFVISSGTLSRMIERTLSVSGYRLIFFSSPWQALQFAVCASPDLLITSVIMDELNGVDLILALRAMKVTCKQRMAVLTSFEDDHKELNTLPAGVSIVHFSDRFCDDVTKVLKSAVI
ncbi:MAG: Hpt domain-containing protein [Alphaproteobacteria bacterium]|nr:Hpt domain-containing protein [Alphaproteobacteria bacterium]